MEYCILHVFCIVYGLKSKVKRKVNGFQHVQAADGTYKLETRYADGRVKGELKYIYSNHPNSRTIASMTLF